MTIIQIQHHTGGHLREVVKVAVPNFFEKETEDGGTVKLDFYYSTGTVKTVLDHLRQGVTQLFGKPPRLTPDLYKQILTNPRVHTDVRYRRI
jgi:hypothetical protein